MQDSKVVYIVYLFDLSMHKFWIDAFPFLSTKKNLNIHFDSLQLLRYKYVKWREFINNNDRFGM